MNRVRHVRKHPVAWWRSRRLQKEHLTYLGIDALTDLHGHVRMAELFALPGAIIEAGVALGGSAVMLARAKNRERSLLLYDVYGMIPSPTEEDGPEVHARYQTIIAGASQGLGGAVYYGYRPDLKEHVRRTLERFGAPPDEYNIHLIEGEYRDTLHPEGAVAVAHIDADWYASVKTCLERIWPNLVPGGIIILDDYDHWSGCRRAVDEWIAGRNDVQVQRHSRVCLIKLAIA